MDEKEEARPVNRPGNMTPAISMATRVSVRVKPEAEARGWVRPGRFVFILIFILISVFVVLRTNRF